MMQKKKIKILLGLFAVLLTAYLSVTLYFYHRQGLVFTKNLYATSQRNHHVIQNINAIDSYLSIHQKAVEQYLVSGDFELLNYVRDSEKLIQKKLAWLEEFNQNTISLWVDIPASQFANAQGELKKYINTTKPQQEFQSKSFQRLFYLTQYNIKYYFDQAQSYISSYDAGHESTEVLKELQDDTSLSLMFVALRDLVQGYNTFFWNDTQFSKTSYHEQTKFLLYSFIVSAVILLLAFFYIGFSVRKYFYVSHRDEEQAALVNARDLETGLFNKESFHVFGSQELARAKRHGHALTILLLRIDSYSQIKENFGDDIADRFVFEVASHLKDTCREYDGVYRYTENTFTVILSETDHQNLYQIISRFKEHVFEQEFFIKDEQDKMTPQVAIGFSFFPQDGDNIETLVQKAAQNMTDQDGKPLSTQQKNEEEDVMDALINSVPQEEEVEEPVQESLPEIDASFYTVSEQDVSEEPAQEIEAETNFQEEEQVEEPLFVPKKFFVEPAKQNKVTGLFNEEQVKSTWHSLVSSELSANQTMGAKVPKMEPPIKNQPPVQPVEIVEEEKRQYAEESDVGDIVPDVVAALTQEDSNMSPYSSQVQKAVSEEITNDQKPRFHDRSVSIKVNSEIDDDFDDITNISDIRVMQADDDSDVIMVDFDEDKPDLAAKFRRKIRDKRKKVAT